MCVCVRVCVCACACGLRVCLCTSMPQFVSAKIKHSPYDHDGKEEIIATAM